MSILAPSCYDRHKSRPIHKVHLRDILGLFSGVAVLNNAQTVDPQVSDPYLLHYLHRIPNGQWDPLMKFR